jgi:hypothetical protein
MWCEIIRTAPTLRQILPNSPDSLGLIWCREDWFEEALRAFQFDLEILTTKKDVHRLGYNPKYLTQISPRCEDKLSSEIMEVYGIEQRNARQGSCFLVYRPRLVQVKNIKQSNSEKYMYPPWHNLTNWCRQCAWIAEYEQLK